MPTITYCPPSYRPELEWNQAPLHGKQPISTQWEAGEPVSTGIDFGDYRRMAAFTRSPLHGRQPPPSWSLDDRWLSEVVTFYLERRLGFWKSLPGTLAERIQKVQAAQEERKAALAGRLDRLLVEQKAECEPKRRAVLAAEIQNIDTQLVLAGREFCIAAGCAYRAYRLWENSVEIGATLGIAPPHVRQVLWRLNRTAALLAQMGPGPGKSPHGHRGPHACENPDCTEQTARPRFCSHKCCGAARRVTYGPPHACENTKCDQQTTRPRFCSHKCSTAARRRARRRAMS